MQRLLKMGFRKVGEWHLSGDGLRYELDSLAPHPNTLYAFIVDGEISYLGKTTRTLRGRLNGYVRPGKTQLTNVRNHANIVAALTSSEVVEIFALPDEDLHYYGGFHLNLAAALEDSLIKAFDPIWNGGRKAAPEEEIDQFISPEPSSSDNPITRVEVVMGDTYWNKGFFNTGIDTTECFGADGVLIELFLGNEFTPVLGTINRTANKNRSPRIFGGRALKNWVQKSMPLGATMLIDVQSPTSIRLHLSVSTNQIDAKT